jgi:exodeoxyribonuclease V alpha subunit
VKGQDGKEKNKKGNWDLAYAVSCHKYQGSEQKTVVVALDSYPAAKMVCDRSWVYTAISRAKRFCYLVGEERTANAFCRVSKMHQRKTFLAEKIRRELLEIQSEGL